MARSPRGLSWQQYKIDGNEKEGLWVAYFNSKPIAKQIAPIGVLPMSLRRKVQRIVRVGMSEQEEKYRRLRLSLLQKGIKIDELQDGN